MAKRGVIFDVDKKTAAIASLESKMGEPGFWDDRKSAETTIREMNGLKRVVESYKALADRAEELDVLWELAEAEGDPEAAEEVKTAYEALSRDFERFELSLMLSGEYDANNAIVSIHPGAGGTEAQDWAQMLLRMYTRWAETRGYAVEVLDLLPGDEAGIKSATFSVKGTNAYGYLNAEKGVHRLVRISPFDASGRRHTSFASVDVLPEVDDDDDIEISPTDLKIDTYRSSGAGGQHVNKTESAIRITHLPTGIVVSCQNERSQHSNRETAMRILRAKLLEMRLAEQRAKLAQIQGQQGDIAWGNQIRSYVFCPYTMVKDHRTDAEVGNVQAVIDGDLDLFIEAYLRQQKIS